MIRIGEQRGKVLQFAWVLGFLPEFKVQPRQTLWLAQLGWERKFSVGEMLDDIHEPLRRAITSALFVRSEVRPRRSFRILERLQPHD